MLTNDSISVWPFLWPLRQISPQFGQILLPICCFAALSPLSVDPLNRRVQCELGRFLVAAARGHVRMIQEQPDDVEIATALQQSTAG